MNTSNVCLFLSESLPNDTNCEVVFYSNPNATFVSVIDASSGELFPIKKIARQSPGIYMGQGDIAMQLA